MRTEIIEPTKNIALRASAGSGKTFALSLRVVNLLLNGVQPERILCITFTNKATNEMYERIISLLRYLAFEMGPSNVRDEARYLLAAMRGDDAGDDGRNAFSRDEITALREKAGRVYRQVVHGVSRLRISTIDSFLNSILRLFPFEAGVTPDFRILTPRVHDRLTLDAFEHFVKSFESDDRLRKLASDLIRKSGKAVSSAATFLRGYFDRLIEMRIGVERLAGRILPCAGDGDCIESISDDLGKLEDLEGKIMAAARAFAGELRDSCPGISKRGAGHLDRYAASGVADLVKLKSLLRDSYEEYSDFRKCSGNRKAEQLFRTIKKDLSLFISLKNRVYRDAILYLFSLFVDGLDEVRRNERGLSFSDVTNTCYRLLVDGGMIEHSPDYFYFRLDSRIDHLLIDEFQDTNFIQWLILRPFVDELTSGIGQRDAQGSFFYVGDPKQSIYRFRGGESRLFDVVLRQYSGRIAAESLNTNYRSARNIVGFVNSVFTRISEGYGFEYTIQEAKKEAEGCVEVVFFEKEGRNGQDDRKKEKTLEWIRELTGKGYREEDIAVLCGKNAQCEEYALFLKDNGVRAVTEGSMSILHSDAVAAVTDLLRYFHNPRQTLYLLNFLFSVPGLLAGPGLAALLSSGGRGGLPGGIAERLDRIAARVSLLPVGNVIRMIIDEFDLAPRFGYDPNLALLLDMAAGPDLDDAVSLAGFLRFVDEELQDVRASRTEAVHAVKVLTIHKSKGLEFPFVIVPEIETVMSVSANDTPLIFTYDEDLSLKGLYMNENRETIAFHPELERAVEEERALVVRDRLNQLYVALTRAMEGLFVTALVKPEDRRRESDSIKLSDVLFEALDGRDYRAGEIPARPVPRAEKEPPQARPRLNNVLDALAARKGTSTPVEERDEEYETLSIENYRARRFGAAFHFAMEVTASFDAAAVDDAMTRVRQMYGAELEEAELDSIRARMERLLSDELFLSLTSGARIEREVTFIRDGRSYVADFVAEGRDEVTVIDFKTQYEDDLIERYERQVKRYCALAREVYGRPCRGYICFVLEDEIRFAEVG